MVYSVYYNSSNAIQSFLIDEYRNNVSGPQHLLLLAVGNEGVIHQV